MAAKPKRHVVVVDGSNLATEGRTLPSLRQLDEAVRAYSDEDPQAEIVVVVDASFEHRIDPSERAELVEAELHGEVVSPPAGAIGRGDAFVLRIAERTGARVLSNDSFQEFHAEHPWLFDEGRLIGGKPVPGIGWIFTPRLPVRGPKSRQVTGKARRSADALSPPVKAAELAKAAKKAAARKLPALPPGVRPKVGDVWTALAAGNGHEPGSQEAGSVLDVERAAEESGATKKTAKVAAKKATAKKAAAAAEKVGAAPKAGGEAKAGAAGKKQAMAKGGAAAKGGAVAKKARGKKAAAASVEAVVEAAAAGEAAAGAGSEEEPGSATVRIEPPAGGHATTADETEAAGAPVKKAATKRTTAKQGTAKQATTKKATTKKATTKQATTKKATTKKAPAKKAPAKQAAAPTVPASSDEQVATTAGGEAAPVKRVKKAEPKKAAAKKARAAKATDPKAGDEKAVTAGSGGLKRAAATTAAARRRSAAGETALPPTGGGRADGDGGRAAAARAAREDPAVRVAIDEAMAEVLAPPAPVEETAKGSAKRAKGQLPSKDSGKAKRRRRRSGAPPPAVNEPLAFITFVATYPLESEMEGEVVSFTSHGAMVDVDLPGGGLLHCYIPLTGMGDPPPAKARQVLSRGERRSFVLVGLDPPRRVAELALPGVTAAAATAAIASAATASRAVAGE